MALLTETNAQYYAGQQAYTHNAGVGIAQTHAWTADTLLLNTTATTNTNFKVIVNNVVQVNGVNYTFLSGTSVSVGPSVVNSVGATVNIENGDIVVIQLLDNALWANYGSYQYIKMEDVINNFLVAYVGEGKLIPSAKRTDIMFHAKRGLQEFSYDTLKSIKSQELTIPESLSIIIPQDYVNYVQMSWIDSKGVKHIIYPTTLTSNPYTTPIQDKNGIPTQDDLGDNLQSAQALTNDRWKTANTQQISGVNINDFTSDVYGWTWDKLAYGRRYGLDPQTSNRNGWFTINDREGKISFSSNLKNKLIILEYISDGLSVNYDMRIPKMAEEAIYMHIAYSILSTRSNIPEYIVRRFKKDRYSELRNAKIRLSNIKLDEFIQVVRGKSKWIKH